MGCEIDFFTNLGLIIFPFLLIGLAFLISWLIYKFIELFLDVRRAKDDILYLEELIINYGERLKIHEAMETKMKKDKKV